ncbi:MAG: AsmA family protein, partial [Acidobacteriaceae bacterium]
MSEPVRPNDAEAGSQIESRSRVRRRRRQFILAAVVLLVVVVVVPPFISLNRFRRTIVHSISAGLGRPVEASAVELQLFPRPGFVLHNLTVGEDPAYGAEPVMTSQTVTAGLRASALWHGRVEIATLRFDAPSVNLVRDAAGHWNFESLLRNSPALHGHGAAHADRSGNHLPFPYVEATEARINFKLGAEKLPFS